MEQNGNLLFHEMGLLSIRFGVRNKRYRRLVERDIGMRALIFTSTAKR